MGYRTWSYECSRRAEPHSAQSESELSWWKRIRRWLGDDGAPGHGRVTVVHSERGAVSTPRGHRDDAIRGSVHALRGDDEVITVAEPSRFDDPEATMSLAEVRRRFMALRRGGIFPHATPDEIPSRDDEFTRLVDRSLVLAGYLSEEDLEEIHRVGETWMKYERRERYAKAAAARSAEAAVQQYRAEQAALKAERVAQARARAEQRAARVAHWRAHTIAFLGDGVSGGLNDHQSHIEQLEARQLPALSTPNQLAEALSIDVSALRWLAFHQETARIIHYTQFEIPKRSGGKRTISAPKPKLAQVQRWLLQNIVARLPVEADAHGFVDGRSVVSNARPHVGRRLVLNLDLESFFPSITFPRVRGLLQSVGYSPSISTVIALLCTECPRVKMTYDGTAYYVAVADRALPQGACTSPGLSNAIATRLDRRLRGLAAKAGWTYTRYADDLTFSSQDFDSLAGFWASARHVIEDEGFRINRKKGRVQRANRRQEVTGIVVNQKVGLPRRDVRRLRAILHNAEKTGLAAQNRENDPKFEARLQGQLAYLMMVDPAKGTPMMDAFRRLQTAARM